MRAVSYGIGVCVLVSLVACRAAEENGHPAETEPFWRADPAPVIGAVELAAARYVHTANAPRGTTFEVFADDLRGHRHLRLRQTVHGIPVFGADVAVHATPTRIVSAAGTVLTAVEVPLAKPQRRAAEAMGAAKQQLEKRTAFELRYRRPRTELVYLPRRGNVHLAWHVEFLTAPTPDLGPGRWHTFVDAHDGSVLAQHNWLTTVPAQGGGPGGNPNVARTWTTALDVVPDAANFAMDTSSDPDVGLPTVHSVITEDWGNTTDSGTIVSGPLAAVGDAPENDAHGFTEITLNMMRDWMGFDSIDNAGFTVRSRVHYAEGFDNAFWDGSQMTYGDGDTVFFPLCGDIDVVSHEIHHGFTERHSNLIYANESGGLNESFSDVAGVAAEFYDEGLAADFDIGRDIVRPGTIPGDALRFMCDPTADGVSIDNLNHFTPGLDVHFSSGISNYAFCRAAHRLSDPVNFDPNAPVTVDGVRIAASVWFEANANYWTQSSTFVQGCQGTMDAARSPALAFSAAQQAALLASWNDAHVYCDGQDTPLYCDTTHTSPSGVITSPNFPSDYPNNHRFSDCIVPAGGGDVTVTFTDFETEESFDFVEVINGATGQTLSITSGDVAPPPATAPIIQIIFVSDVSVVERGFRATWNTVGGVLTALFDHQVEHLNVTFTDSSSGANPIVSWAWDFGDGTTSTAQNPSHTYATNGTYTVTLVVTDDQDQTDEVSRQVVVQANQPPIANFSVSRHHLWVTFTDFSSDIDGTIAQRIWTFGDGLSSPSQNPVHQYQAPGTYTVTLRVTDDDGAVSETSQEVEVSENASPEAAFRAEIDGLSVRLTDESRDSDGTIRHWLWSFGDGSGLETQHASHTFPRPGVYRVTLTVTDNDGAKGEESQTIDVRLPPVIIEPPTPEAPSSECNHGSASSLWGAILCLWLSFRRRSEKLTTIPR